MEQPDFAAIASIVDYLSDPRDSASIGDIAAATGLTEPDARAALGALKDAAIIKVSGRGKNQKWYLDLSLELPVELPAHLRPGAEATPPEPEVAESPESDDAAEDVDNDLDAADNPSAPQTLEATAEYGTDDEETTEDRSTATADDAGTDPGQNGREDAAAPSEAAPVWTVGGELLEERTDAKFGLIDIEAMSVFHLLPAHDADSGVDMVYLTRMLGAALSTTRIVKALWMMWEHGIAQARGQWRPDRGEWKLTEGAKLEHLKAFAMSNAPRRVTCPDCGHDGALNYKPDKGSTVRTFDPDAPAPAGFEERISEEGHRRNPVVMICAMTLHYIGVEMTARQIADYTGHTEPVVLQALWAMRVCRIVECTDVRRADGGAWRANEATFRRPEWVRLTDAPDALGCATCGQAIGTRAAISGNTGGKATKGVSRAQTHDGGEPLPQGSLPLMIKAWAIHAPGLEPAAPGDDPTVRTPAKLLGDLQAACGSGRMVDWLATWVERHPQDAVKAGAASEAIAKGGHPRSAGAVKNTLVALTGSGLIEEVKEARVETYRSIVEAAPDTAMAENEHESDDEAPLAEAEAQEPAAAE